MPPKSVIKSMQAYARSLGNALDMIDVILARIPKGEGAPAPPEEVLLELERAKAIAVVKFERMDENYELQSVSEDLTEDMEALTPRSMKRPSKGTLRPCKP